MVNSKADKVYWKEALDLIASKNLVLNSLTTKKITLKQTSDAFQYNDIKK